MNTTKKHKVGWFRRSSFFKMLMVIVYVLSILSLGGGSILSVICIDQNIYSSTLEEIQYESISNRCRFQVDDAYQAYLDLKNTGYFDEETSDIMKQGMYDQYMLRFNPERTNFFFKVENEESKVLLQSADLPSQYEYRQYYQQSETTDEIVNMTPEELEAYAPASGERMEIVNEIYAEPETSSTESETMLPTESETYLPTDENIAVTGAVQTETPGMELPTGDGMVYVGAVTEAAVQHEEEEIIQESEEATEPVVQYYEVRITRTVEKPGIFITGYVKETLDSSDNYKDTAALIQLVWDFRYAPFVLIGAGFIGFFFALWFLLSGAGYRTGNDAAELSVFDRIPFDLFTGLHMLLGIFLLAFTCNILNIGDDLGNWLTLAGAVTAIALIVILWLMSAAVRIRTNTLWKNNILTMVWHTIRRGAHSTSKAIQALPLIWQAPALVALFFFLQFIGVVMILADWFPGIALLIMLWCLGLIAAIILIINMHYLEKGAEKLAKGDFEHKIQENQLFGPFRRHAKHLNSIGDGMNRAVTERLKSETFKSELIANVSHDIRTPLTSIINYTDLLAKLNLDDPQAQEYIDVLQRQSARLRKLTEDVLEASKASTGNLTVERGLLDMRVLIEQMLGEYAERLEAAQLQIVSSLPEEPLYIMADGRLMWRVMDNLFANICKYAMHGTRVYLDTNAASQEITIVLRNISGTQLNISAEALMERFVRGDRSRNTEGSGLGLSIAQSLTELQGGSLKIEIDGDLFKVTLRFPQSQTTDSE